MTRTLVNIIAHLALLGALMTGAPVEQAQLEGAGQVLVLRRVKEGVR